MLGKTCHVCFRSSLLEGLYHESSYTSISAIMCVHVSTYDVYVCVCVILVCLDEYGKMPCIWTLKYTSPILCAFKIRLTVVKKYVGRLFSLFLSHCPILRYCQVACRLLPVCYGCLGLNFVPCVFHGHQLCLAGLSYLLWAFFPCTALSFLARPLGPLTGSCDGSLLLSHLMTSLMPSVALTWWF